MFLHLLRALTLSLHTTASSANIMIHGDSCLASCISSSITTETERGQEKDRKLRCGSSLIRFYIRCPSPMSRVMSCCLKPACSTYTQRRLDSWTANWIWMAAILMVFLSLTSTSWYRKKGIGGCGGWMYVCVCRGGHKVHLLLLMHLDRWTLSSSNPKAVPYREGGGLS